MIDNDIYDTVPKLDGSSTSHIEKKFSSHAKNDASHQACKTLVLTQVAVMRT